MTKTLLQTLTTLGCLWSVSLPALAMTETQASSNMMYFAFAMKEGELCGKLGFPGMQVLRRWEQQNAAVLVKSLRRVEDYALATQKLTREQAKDVSLGLFLRHKESFDREMAPNVGAANCMRLGETLRLYETKLIRE
jgi:hypothetical protein